MATSQQPEKSRYSWQLNKRLAGQKVGSCSLFRGGEYRAHEHAQPVGQDHFFKVAPQHAERAARHAGVAEGRGV